MLQRFFAKKNHPQLENKILELLQNLSLTPQQWTFKQQTASYQQPYRYVAQGQGWTLSCYEQALKEKERGEQTELVLTCTNAPWLTLLARQPQQVSNHKIRLDVSLLSQQEDWGGWQWHSNNHELAQEVLEACTAFQQLFEELEAVELVLEKQRLYMQWSWLPTSPARQQQLQQSMALARALTQALDELTPAL